MQTRMRKPLAVLLSALMLLTVVSVGLVPLAAFAGISADGDLPTLTFYVPETIYLKASDNKTFQYFINREQTDAGALRTAQDTTGMIYFKCADATAVTNLTCGGASVNLSTTTPSANTLKATVNSGALNSAVSMTGTALIPWTVTFTYQGVSRTATAYSVAYAPNRNVTADGTYGYSYHNNYKAYSSGLIYIQGAQKTGQAGYAGYVSDTYRYTGYQNTNTSTKALDPLVNGVSTPTDNRPSGYFTTSSPFTGATKSCTGCNCIVEVDNGQYANNNDWILHTDYNTTSAEITVDKSRYSNTDQVPNLGLGYIVTDYANCVNRKNWYVSDATNEVTWSGTTPILTNSNYAGKNLLGHEYFQTDAMAYAAYEKSYGTVLRHSGGLTAPALSGSTESGGCGIKYQEPIAFDLTSLASGNTTTRFFRGVCSGRANADGSNSCYAISCCAVSLKITAVDKDELRTLVNNCIGSYMQQHYTASTWSAYKTALESAETALGDPEATASEISTAVSNLTTAKNALVRGTGTATVNHVSASGVTLGTETKAYNYGETVTASANTYIGYTYTSASPANMTVNDISAETAGWTLTYTPVTYNLSYDLAGGSATNPATFNIETDTFTLAEPTRTGYTFTGWTGTGLSEPTKPLAIEKGSTGDRSYTANWEPVPYTLTLDTAGGDAIAPIEYNIESTDTVPQPTRAGYDFVEWTAADVQGNWTSGQVYAVGMPLTNQYGDVTLQASWTVRHDTAYTVNHYYMEPDGSYPAAPQAQTFIGTTENVVTAADAAAAPANYTLDTAASDDSVAILGDGTAALDLYYARDAFTVTFNVDGTETSNDYYYGATPAYTGTAPTLAGTDANTYTFLGWTANAAAEPGSDAAYYAAGNLPPVTADVTYYPYFGAAVNSYDITFTVEGVDTTLSFPYGATPAYNGIPAKAADAANTYAFSGWSPAIEAVTGEATYVAQFTATPISYLVRATAGAGSTITDVTGIYNYNDTVEFTVTVAEGYTGTPVVSVNGTPVDAAAANGSAYEYSIAVTGNTEITVADLTKQTFTVKFDVDGTETEKTVAYGDTPAYGSVPAKAATAQYTYAFTGWDPEIVPATADAEYTAQFSETLRSYAISFVTPTGTTTISVPYGDTPAPGFTPAKAADAENTYEFAGWSPEIEAVTGEAAYTAQFTATPIPVTKYLVTTNAGVGSALSVVAGLYNAGAELAFTVTVDAAYSDSEPVVTAGDTVLQRTGKEGLVFSYALTVNADTEISVGDLTRNEYTVIFKNYDDTALYTTTVLHGDDVAYVGQTPMKPADENVYTFTGWSVSTNNVTGDLTVTAQYSSEPLVIHTHDYSINCYDADYHWMGCACGAVDGEKEAHSFVSAHNATVHWEECDCGYRKNSEAHTFADANDGAYHWEECACGEIRNKEAHSFTTTDFDATGHWQVCANCGALSASQAHVLTLTYNATQHYFACDCGYTEGAEDHTLVTQHDATGHRQTCGCGYATATEAHSFDTETDAGAATCSTLAYSVKACACGETQRTESGSLDPDTHTGPYKVVGARAATTTAEGYTGDTICLACGGTAEQGHYTDMLSVSHTHSYDAEIETGEATCVAPAYVIKQCECGATQKIESGDVNADAHIGPYKVVGARDATTTAEGYTGDKICLACGGTAEAGHYTDMIADPHEHVYATVTESGAATCVAPAYEIKACACGATQRFDGDTLDPDNHVHTILVGARAATATTDGYTGDTVCTACGNTIETGTVIPKTDPGHTHSYDTEAESAPATCVAKAYTIYQCSCGDTKKVETGEVNANNHAGEIRLLGAREATETVDGYSGDKYCLACGNLVEAGHVLPHTGTTTPENPTQPDQPSDNGGGSTDTRIPFFEWLRNLIRKLLALFNISSGSDTSNC